MTTPNTSPAPPPGTSSFLPKPGTWGYHFLLGSVGILILGPLGGVTASFMNFSIGFFVGGQVLAGILGSTVTYGYGPEGKHGANFMQTCAASVAGLSGMAVLIQAMVWLGLPLPPAWQLVLYLLCIGMFGVGVGMLYTPILVDRLQLPYPSGLAVANILRALTDKKLLRRSILTLGSGTLTGIVGGVGSLKITFLETIGLSTSTLGAGMIVGARIGIPAIVGGLISSALKPYFVRIGWLDAGAPFRKITFIIALGMIMGAALVDIALIMVEAVKRIRGLGEKPNEASSVGEGPDAAWKRTNTTRLVLWCVVWGVGVLATGMGFMGAPLLYLVVALGLVFLFVMINGISQGISDSNPISSAFVVTVLLMGSIGLKAPAVGLMAAAVVFVSVSVACDMQQDRSTGWRLGSDRTTQFRYQVAGVAMGAVMAVVFAKVFMQAYPDLAINQTNAGVEVKGWQSAMTYKMVGAIQNLTHPKPYTYKALQVGLALGLVTEILRKWIRNNEKYKALVKRESWAAVGDFVLDAFLLPSPYASSFGGFVELPTSYWFGGGGILGSLLSTYGEWAKQRETEAKREKAGRHVASGQQAESDETPVAELPEDMSTVSLLGGGLIAGDSLAALGFGISVLLSKLHG